MITTVRTSPGLIREKNEDATLVTTSGLYAVADGMGGHKAGEVASRIAIETIAESIQSGCVSPKTLRDAVSYTNAIIYGLAGSDETYQGMGTTLTALWTDGATALIAHVGDSRAYLLRDGTLHRCTRDHTLVDELVRKKKITQEAARSHPQKSVITRAVGVASVVNCDIFEWETRFGDRWLICSDGLTDMLDDAQIAGRLNLPLLEDAADALLRDALSMGGRDNISFILIEDDGERHD